MHATICTATTVFNVKDIVNWLERYLAILDCYTWVARASLAKPALLLLGILLFYYALLNIGFATVFFLVLESTKYWALGLSYM